MLRTFYYLDPPMVCDAIAPSSKHVFYYSKEGLVSAKRAKMYISRSLFAHCFAVSWY